MEQTREEHEAWIAANAPTLWAYIRNQRPPQARPIPRSIPSLPVATNSLSDLLTSMIDVGLDTRREVNIKKLGSEEQATVFVRLLTQSVVTHTNSDMRVVLYNDWVYLPWEKVCIQVNTGSQTAYKLLRLPVLTLDGVMMLEQGFTIDPGLRPGKVDSLLIQTELIQGKSLTPSDIISSQNWENDLEITLQTVVLFTSQQQEIDKKGLTDLYRLHREAQEPIALCQAMGCGFDCAAHSSLISLWKIRLQNIHSELNHTFPGINLASNHQLSSAMRHYLERCGEMETLAKWPKTNTKLLKTDIDTFKSYRNVASLTSVLDRLITYRSLLKADNTYGEALLKYVRESRLHSRFKLNGCVTGRLTSSEPNLQNIPRTVEFRRLFNTCPGYVLVIGDFSQIELRIAAVLSGDPVMLSCYRNKEDLHQLTACALLGIQKNQVTGEQRHLAKAVNFGILYGQGPRGLAKYCKANYDVVISKEEARRYIDKFHAQFSVLTRWQSSVLSSPTASTPMGRMRTLQGFSDNEKLNLPIQGGAAEVMLLALVFCHRAIRKFGAVIVNIVHDELVIETPQEHWSACVDAVTAAMKLAFKYYCEFLEVQEDWDVAEVHSGPDWSCKLSHG